MIYDTNFNPIDESEIDLSIGMITLNYKVKEGVAPVDNITKFIYAPEDLEEIKVYVVDQHAKMRKEMENVPTEIDRLEARLTYLEMMTGYLEGE